MYIFELILRYIQGKKHKAHLHTPQPQNDEVTTQIEDCEHFFMPVDSTGEILACKYCGLIINKNDHNL